MTQPCLFVIHGEKNVFGPHWQFTRKFPIFDVCEIGVSQARSCSRNRLCYFLFQARTVQTACNFSVRLPRMTRVPEKLPMINGENTKLVKEQETIESRNRITWLMENGKRSMVMKFPELFYCNQTCILTGVIFEVLPLSSYHHHIFLSSISWNFRPFKEDFHLNRTKFRLFSTNVTIFCLDLAAQ